MEKHCLDVIRTKRRELDYSQDYVADKLGISQRAYSDIENGKIALRNKTRLKLAKVLDLNPDDICPIANSCSNIHKLKNEKLINLLIQNNVEIPDYLL